MKRAGIAIPTVVLRMAAILMSAACGPSCLAQDATALLSAQRDQADTAQEEASAAPMWARESVSGISRSTIRPDLQ